MNTISHSQKTRRLLLDAIEVPDSVKQSTAYVSRFKNATFKSISPVRSITRYLPFSKTQLDAHSPAPCSACSEETQLTSGEAEEYVKTRHHQSNSLIRTPEKHRRTLVSGKCRTPRHRSLESRPHDDPLVLIVDVAFRKERKSAAIKFLRDMGSKFA